MTTTTELTEIGQSVGGQRDSYQLSGGRVRRGRRADPRIRARCDVLRELAAGASRRSPRTSTWCAPDMVGFGYSDRPEDVKYSAGDLGRPDRRVDGRARHREGPPGRQQLRRGDRAAHRHQAPGPDRQAGADGQHGRALRRSPPGLDTVWGYEGTLEDMRKVLDYFAYSRDLVNEELARSATRPASSPASRNRSRRCSRRHGSAGWTRCRTAEEDDQGPAAPHPDRARPGGQGHPAVETSLKLERTASTTPTCRCSRTAGTGR